MNDRHLEDQNMSPYLNSQHAKSDEAATKPRFKIVHNRANGSTYTYDAFGLELAQLLFECGCNAGKLDHVVYGADGERNVVGVMLVDLRWTSLDGPTFGQALVDEVPGYVIGYWDIYQ